MLALLVASAVLAAAGAQTRDGFVSLLDGTLDAWTVENGGRFSVTGGVLTAEGPEGWLKSRRRYADFELRAELRFLTEEGDSGIFVRALADTQFGRGWPNASYQLQLLNPLREGRFPLLGSVLRHGMPNGATEYDPAVAKRLFTGVGEWQSLTLEVRGETLVARLNGELLTRASGIGNAAGFIGIQGETSALEFRRIEIREL